MYGIHPDLACLCITVDLQPINLINLALVCLFKLESNIKNQKLMI